MPVHAADPLAEFQDAFAGLLQERDVTAVAPADVAALARQPGFAIYRNTVFKGCVDALQANYPAVARIVGDEWFRAAAAIYARANLPRDPALVRYGDGFAAFLAAFAPAAEMPYLPDVARLDRCWTEAHTARDAPCVDASALASLDTGDPARIVLEPHPSARWVWFASQPAFTLWRRNRAGGNYDDSAIAWRGEGALLLRPHEAVRWIELDAGGCALLDTCAAGGSVAAAATATLATHPAADFASLIARLFEAGAFTQATVSRIDHEEGSP